MDDSAMVPVKAGLLQALINYLKGHPYESVAPLMDGIFASVRAVQPDLPVEDDETKMEVTDGGNGSEFIDAHAGGGERAAVD